MMTINLNQIPTEYIMRTKAGKLWRCGKGYRKNWNKLMNKVVLLHNKAFTLLNRVKEEGKWYLVFTDGTNNYTERQDKALHNKHLAKDTIIEAVKRVIAGLLPAPKELIDQLLDEANRTAHFKCPNDPVLSSFEKFVQFNKVNGVKESLFNMKLGFVLAFHNDKQSTRRLCIRLLNYYHPDRGNYPIEYSQMISTILSNTRQDL